MHGYRYSFGEEARVYRHPPCPGTCIKALRLFIMVFAYLPGSSLCPYLGLQSSQKASPLAKHRRGISSSISACFGGPGVYDSLWCLCMTYCWAIHCLLLDLHVYIYIYTHTCMHAYIRTYMHAYIHTYMKHRKNIHVDIHSHAFFT